MAPNLHKNATTTPKIRKEIQESSLSLQELCKKYNLSITTVRRWKNRDTVEDRSHTAHNLQTTLSSAQEEVVVALRQIIWLSLDDLLTVVHEFIHPTMLRSSLHRLLKRRGVSRKPAAAKKRNQKLKSHEPGYIYINIKPLPTMLDEKTQQYIFIGVDRATRWVFIKIYKNKNTSNVRKFLSALQNATPSYIRIILTESGKEFTDRFITMGTKTPKRRAVFEQLCQELAVDDKLRRPEKEQSSEMPEHFNGKLEDIFQTDKFQADKDLEKIIYRYVNIYNSHLPQKALSNKSPIDSMKQWQVKRPDLFPEHDINHKEQEEEKHTNYWQIPTTAMQKYISSLFNKK